MHKTVNRLLALTLLSGGALLWAGSAPAHAALSVTLDSTSPAGANTLFNYSIDLATGDIINSGNFFRIYDFGGYVSGSITAPTGWTASVSLSNPTPPPNVLLSYGDDPTIPNLIFTYTGSTPLTGATVLTGFSAKTSTFTGTYAIKDYVGRVSTQAGIVDSVGPNAVAPNTAVVPEPSSLALLLGSGLSGTCLVVRRRRKR
jgi:hypothetical protein